MSRAAPHVREKPLELWALAASPTVWALHFVLSYGTAAIWCAKVATGGGSLGRARAAMALYTAVALAAVAVVGWRGWRRHRHGGEAPPHDDDSPEDRHRFLGFSAALLSALSGVAIVYTALAAVFIGSCR
jgi:hypothetical protein